MRHIPLGVMTLAVITTLTGCTQAMMTASAQSSSLLKERLQTMSAGHTGCLPEDNQVSIIWAKADGSGLWKATCKDKTYLCSTVELTRGGNSFSCAPEVK
jgi:hypothetical protein